MALLEDESVKKWKVTRNIPVALLAAIGVQLMVMAWIASKYDSRITDQGTQIATLAKQVETNAVISNSVSMKLATIEGKLELVLNIARERSK